MSHQITGTLFQTNRAQVQALLDGWLGETRHRARLFGHTWILTTDQVDFHLETTDPSSATYCLDVRMSGTRDECAAWTERLVAALQSADILYDVSREEYDERGEVLDGEVTYVHPEFEARYVPSLDSRQPR
jgi:hypothetical protein